MKIIKLFFLLTLLFFSIRIYSTEKRINATYSYDIDKFLTINEDSFLLFGRLPFATELYDLDRGDSILAEGKVQYESDKFIRLTSKDYELEAKKNMTIIDSMDSCLNDSLRFTFIFPFDGKYKIILYLGNDYKNEIKYELENQNEIILPTPKDSISTFSFRILNQTPIDPYRNYLKNVQFGSFLNTIKSNNSNSFKIYIPDLTNSYFNRYLINGEYIRVSKNRDILFFHNEKYTRSIKQ